MLSKNNTEYLSSSSVIQETNPNLQQGIDSKTIFPHFFPMAVMLHNWFWNSNADNNARGIDAGPELDHNWLQWRTIN